MIAYEKDLWYICRLEIKACKFYTSTDLAYILAIQKGERMRPVFMSKRPVGTYGTEKSIYCFKYINYAIGSQVPNLKKD